MRINLSFLTTTTLGKDHIQIVIKFYVKPPGLEASPTAMPPKHCMPLNLLTNISDILYTYYKLCQIEIIGRWLSFIYMGFPTSILEQLNKMILSKDLAFIIKISHPLSKCLFSNSSYWASNNNNIKLKLIYLCKLECKFCKFIGMKQAKVYIVCISLWTKETSQGYDSV